MSQKARRNAARATAARATPVEALNREIQRTPAMRCAIGQAARKRTERTEFGPADRSSGSASETSIHALRCSRELSCSPKQGKHRRMVDHACRIQRAKRFYERDAILLSLRAQAEAIDAHARSCARHREPLRTKPGKRFGKTRLCRLASAGHSTRPTDFQAILRREGDVRLRHRPHERAGAIAATSIRSVSGYKHRTSGQPATVHRRASPAEDGKR